MACLLRPASPRHQRRPGALRDSQPDISRVASEDVLAAVTFASFGDHAKQLGHSLTPAVRRRRQDHHRRHLKGN
jgi:hypothetical protein